MTIEKSPRRCEVCGADRIRTPSGRVCVNGHGRIYPKGTPAQKRRAEFLAWRETLPEAVRVKPWPEWKRVAFTIGDFGDTLYQYWDVYEKCTQETRCLPSQVLAKVRVGNGWLVRRFMTVVP